MDRDGMVASVLATPQCREAITGERPGEVIQLVRKALGLKQADLGQLTGYSQSAISRIETGGLRSTETRTLARLGAALGIPPASLGLAIPAGIGTTADVGPTLDVDPREDDVRRSTFLRGLIGLTAAAAIPVELATDEPGQVTMSTVQSCRDTLGRLTELDWQQGGGQLVHLAGYMVERIQGLLDRGRYTMAVGRELYATLASAGQTAGWVAHDAGRHDLARTWWLEAIHAATIAGDRDTHVMVLSAMALRATNVGHAQQALSLVATGREVRTKTPRLRSLLAAREALGHATAGDKAGVRESLAEARHRLTEQSDADPVWLAFWGPADLACHETTAYTSLGDHQRAEAAARDAVNATDAGIHPRNSTLYTLQLAGILARHGDLREAMATVRPLVVTPGRTSSSRAAGKLRDALVGIQGRGTREAREFAQWARRVHPAIISA